MQTMTRARALELVGNLSDADIQVLAAYWDLPSDGCSTDIADLRDLCLTEVEYTQEDEDMIELDLPDFTHKE